jgi:hypothetical protein
MAKRLLIIFLVNLSLLNASGQIGGEYTYQFLELTNSARMAALGGKHAASSDFSDLSLPFYNPALLHPEMSNSFLASYVNYLSDINYGYVSYARSFEGIGNFALGMHYLNYGKFRETNTIGEFTGAGFSAAEYALNIIYSYSIQRWRIGATFKPLLSKFENYQSVGIAGDVGISYVNSTGLSSVGLVARNFGTQLTTYYTDGKKESIPFNLMAGLYKKLQYAPVAFSVTLQNLTNWDLANPEPEPGISETDEFSDIYERSEGFGKQIMRHTLFGIELLPVKAFVIRAGYNYQRRQELKFSEKLSTTGLSVGFGVKVKKFRFDFASSRYHLAGSSNTFSFAINLN